MVEKILWFPSNRRISYVTPSRPPTNPTASFSTPMTGIACHWKTLEKKPLPSSKKTPDRPVVLAVVNSLNDGPADERMLETNGCILLIASYYLFKNICHIEALEDVFP